MRQTYFSEAEVLQWEKGDDNNKETNHDWASIYNITAYKENVSLKDQMGS